MPIIFSKARFERSQFLSFITLLTLLTSWTLLLFDAQTSFAGMTRSEIEHELNWIILIEKNENEVQKEYYETSDYYDRLAKVSMESENWCSAFGRCLKAPRTSPKQFYLDVANSSRSRMIPWCNQVLDSIDAFKSAFDPRQNLIDRFSLIRWIAGNTKAFKRTNKFYLGVTEWAYNLSKSTTQKLDRKNELLVERRKEDHARLVARGISKAKANRALDSAYSQQRKQILDRRKRTEELGELALEKFDFERERQIAYEYEYELITRFLEKPEVKIFYEDLIAGRLDFEVEPIREMRIQDTRDTNNPNDDSLSPNFSDSESLAADQTFLVENTNHDPEKISQENEENENENQNEEGQIQTRRSPKIKTRGTPDDRALRFQEDFSENQPILINPTQDLHSTIQIAYQDLEKLRGKHLSTIRSIFANSVSVEFHKFENAWLSIPGCELRNKNGSSIGFLYRRIPLFMLHRPHERGTEIYRSLGQRIQDKLTERGITPEVLDELAMRR